MATYTELFDIRSNTALRNRIAVAVAVKAQAYIDGGAPTADELTWSNAAISNPLGEADMLMNYVLAANKGQTVSDIEGASDATIQANVDAAVNALVGGGVT